VTHRHIPDDPTIESERRQIFYGKAVGIPTFFVNIETKNLFLKKILGKAKKLRASRRYPGYLRVYHKEYLKALLNVIQEDGSELIDMFGLHNDIKDLKERLEDPDQKSATGKLIQGITAESGKKTSPIHTRAREFNLSSEDYYRNALRKRHMEEAFSFLEEILGDIHKNTNLSVELKHASSFAIGEMDISSYLARCKKALIQDLELSIEQITRLINLAVLAISHESLRMAKIIRNRENASYETSVCR
jgi:cell division septum initiation protein DivIVA